MVTNGWTLSLRLYGYWKNSKINRIHIKTDNKKRCLLILRVLQKTQDDYSKQHEYLHKSMIEICREENVSLHQVFTFGIHISRSNALFKISVYYFLSEYNLLNNSNLAPRYFNITLNLWVKITEKTQACLKNLMFSLYVNLFCF